MAVLPFTPGINIAVLVDGEPAKEYQPWEFPEIFDAIMNQGIPHTKCYINTLAGASDLGEEYVDEISYCQRDFSDGSSESYRPVFEDIRPGKSTATIIDYNTVDEADGESVNSDLQRIKTLGTVQVAIEVGKQTAPVPMGDDDFCDDKRNESLAIDNKALLLNGHGQIHGTTYTKTDETRQMTYITVDDEQHLGNFFFFYLSRHSPGTQFFFQPRFINRFADDMIHILSLPKLTHMLNGEVDNTYIGNQ
ncbi:3',5'-cyclic-nucleotide phosphodiesterase [Fusarium oxysporum f. sp. albedinis]|nr:3',5'-cyclic-nucleotide phosphodiesterase [Fusarium oxysporum f. sp. albedinis]